MQNAARALTGLAALSFLLAVATAFLPRIGGIEAEGWSRASTNLALIAIAICLLPNGKASASR